MVQTAEIIDYEDWGNTQPQGTVRNPFSVETLIDEDTGVQVNDVDWLASQHRQEEIHRQTLDVANILNGFGVKTKVDSNLHFVGLVTDVRTEITSWRNINCLLEVAQQNRKPQQNTLGMFLGKYENRHARYATAAYGERIPEGGNLREAMREFTDKIKMFAYIARHEWDVEVILRVFEMPRNDEGTYHLHSNIVYVPQHRMGKRKWAAWLKFMTGYFGPGSKDNGVIKNINEIVKYCIKGDDIEKLINTNPEGLLWFYEQTFNTKIFSPLGSFREFRRDLNKRRLKVIKRKGSYVVVRKKSLKLPKSEQEGLDGDTEATESVGDKTNEIVGITQPFFHTSPLKEPCLVVRNLKPFSASNQPMGTYVELLCDMQEWQDRAREAWKRNTDVTPEYALKYARMLRETKDVNKVAVLSKHKRKVAAKAQSYANDRIMKKAQKDLAAGKSISVHTSTTIVENSDIERAEKEIIKHQRRVSSIKMLKNLDTGDPPSGFDVENTKENAYNFLRIFWE